jgi:AAA domain
MSAAEKLFPRPSLNEDTEDLLLIKYPQGEVIERTFLVGNNGDPTRPKFQIELDPPYTWIDSLTWKNGEGLVSLITHLDGADNAFQIIKELRAELRSRRDAITNLTANDPIAPIPKPALKLSFGYDTLTPQPLGTVVAGILHAGSVTLIYGPPKSGKSFLVTDLALSIAAAERAWMGHEIVRPGPVLVVACEGHAGYWKRVVAAAQDRGWTEETFPQGFILATGRPTLIRAAERGLTFAPDPSSILQALATAKQKGLKPVAIFIDTVFRSVGAGNVNASPDMNAYLDAVGTLTDQGYAVGLVHHEIKSGGTPAGSVSLIGGSDDIIHVWRESDTSEQRFWQVEMAKDDAETPPRAFTLAGIPIGLDPDGRPASSCVIRDAGAAPDAGKKKRGRPPGQSAEATLADLIYRELVNLLADSREPLQELSPKFPYGAIARSRLDVAINQAGILATAGSGEDPKKVERANEKKVSKILNTLKNQQKVNMDRKSIGLPVATPRDVAENPEPIS